MIPMITLRRGDDSDDDFLTGGNSEDDDFERGDDSEDDAEDDAEWGDDSVDVLGMVGEMLESHDLWGA